MKALRKWRAALMSDPLDNPKYFINRDFSALAFNERVLSLARNERLPLLERMRFLCICSGNLDEFFEIRVSGLKEKIAQASPKRYIDGLSSEELFQKLSKKAHVLYDELYRIYNILLLPALKKEGIQFINHQAWSNDVLL